MVTAKHSQNLMRIPNLIFSKIFFGARKKLETFIQITTLGLILITSLQSHSFTLEEIRNITRTESSKSLADISQNRIREIRADLNTAQYSIGNKALISDLPSNRERGDSSSDYIKFIFRKVMNKFTEDVRYGAPQLVDPSTMWHELQSKEDEYYTRLYAPILTKMNEELNTNVQEILLGYNAIVLGKNKEKLNSQSQAPIKAVSCANVPKQLSFNGNSADLAKWMSAKSIIEKYLSENTKISDQLGFIWRLDIVQGRIQRIRFTKCSKIKFGANLNLSDQDQVMINLSSLISIYTGMDDLFIQTQIQFLKVVDAEIAKIEAVEDKKSTRIAFFKFGGLSAEEETRLNIFKDVKANLELKIQGAKHFNQTLNLLTKSEIAKLIDLLIQLNINDIPSENDIKSVRDYHEEIFNKMQRDPVFSRDYQSTINQIELALKYYQSLHNDLNILENGLKEMKAGRNFIDKFKRELRK